MILTLLMQLFNNYSLLFSILIIASIAGLYSEKAGIVNITIEGLMIIGALIYSLLGNNFSKYNNHITQIISLIIVIISGGIFSILFAFSTITLKSQPIISGTAINILSSGIGMFFITTPYWAKGNMIITNFETISIDNFQIINIFLIITLFLIIFTFFFFKYTKYGIKFIGANSDFEILKTFGININKLKYIAIIITGSLSSLSGAIFTHFSSGQFRGYIQGYGYIALAIIILSHWKIQYICLNSLIFSFLISFINILWKINKWNIADPNNQLLKIIPFIFSLLTMAILSKKISNQTK